MVGMDPEILSLRDAPPIGRVGRCAAGIEAPAGDERLVAACRPKCDASAGAARANFGHI
jgi:hypothetical protein